MPGTRKILFVIALLSIGNLGLSGQFQQDLYILKDNEFPEAKSLELYLNGAGFLNNNEFFDTHAEGYTLIGNYFQPYFSFHFTENFSLNAGGHLLWYHGQDKFNRVLPFFSMDYQVLPLLNIKIGSFNQGGLLRLPEPMYKFENQYTDLTAEGIIINKTGEIWESVTWIDWLKFIEAGDPFREEFIFGHSGSLKFINTGNNTLETPVFILANHKGGQINDNDEPVETRADLGTGMKWTHMLDLPMVNELSILGHCYFESGIKSNRNGNAFFTYGEMKGDILTAGIGYFYEKNWESILGQPLYFSPQLPDQTNDREHDLIVFKLGLARAITKTSSVSIRFEGYFDPGIKKLQYTYGVHIIMNEWLEILNK